MLALVKSAARKKEDTMMSLADLVPLDAVSPELAAARARRNELTLKQSSLQLELNELAHELANFRASEAAGRRPVDHEADRRVAALVDGVAPVAVQPPPHMAALEKIKQKNQEVDDIKKAIEILDDRISKLVWSASAKVCEKVAPIYAERVAAVARALIKLHAEHVLYDDFADAMNNERVWWAQLNPMPPRFLDASRDKNGNVARYLKEAAASGFISADEIPERLR